MSSSQPVREQTHTVQTNGHNTASKLKLSPKKPTHVANEQFLSLGDIQQKKKKKKKIGLLYLW